MNEQLYMILALDADSRSLGSEIVRIPELAAICAADLMLQTQKGTSIVHVMQWSGEKDGKNKWECIHTARLPWI